jgi:ABC-type sulfate/molybdate transport systems ATPase subunit
VKISEKPSDLQEGDPVHVSASPGNSPILIREEQKVKQNHEVEQKKHSTSNPDVLLCDEPTGALDYSTSKEILKLIEEVNAKYRSTVVLVTHNDALKDMADRVVRLKDGRILSDTKNEVRIPAAQLEW